MIRRYGKSSDALFEIKQDFFKDNDRLLARAQELAEIYKRQPRRRRCKNCDAVLRGNVFIKQGVEYILCDVDGHLNGAFEDSDEYARAVYVEEGGRQYAEVYREVDQDSYQRRVDTIYVPKVEFLISSLEHCGEDPLRVSYGDLGAGSGFLIAAFERNGIESVRGYEVSDVQAEVANEMLGREAVSVCGLDDVIELVRSMDVNVLTMIGTLEHLQRPRDILRSIRTNEAIRYLYLQLPLFSVSVLLEAAAQDVWPRQLSGGHTHLYTESSIEHFCREFGFERVAEWWFGTDVMDLFRQVFVRLETSTETSSLTTIWESSFRPTIDALQLEFDKRRLSSQIHLLLEKR